MINGNGATTFIPMKWSAVFRYRQNKRKADEDTDMAKPDWYDTDNCETHDKGAPKFCKKSEPGEGTERSCAYDGARVVLMPITDVIHLVHGPIGCAGNSWDNRGARSSDSQLYRRGFTTEMLENDVIFGGEKKLYKAILDLAERYKDQARAIFVYATCVTAMTGDDVEAVCTAAAEKVAIPVIPVNTPGFIGDKNIGNRLAGEIMFKYVIGTTEPPFLGEYPINLIGEYNIAGDLWGMLPLFDRLGIQVLSCFSGDAKFEELRYAHRAKLNVIICSKSLTNLAKKMQKTYGMPYLEESFYGMTDTAKALRDIARELDNIVNGLEKRVMQDRVERLIEEEEGKCRAAIAPYRARLEGKTAVLFTGGVKTWSMVNSLTELGVEVLAAGTQNSTLEDFYRMKGLMHKDATNHRGHLHRRSAGGHAREDARPDRGRRQDQVPGAQDQDPVHGHQSWPLPSLCRLRGDGDLFPAAGHDRQQPDLADPERPGALGEERRAAGGGPGSQSPVMPRPFWPRISRPRGSRSPPRPPRSTRRRTHRPWGPPWPTWGSTTCSGCCTAPRGARPSSACSCRGTTRSPSP